PPATPTVHRNHPKSHTQHINTTSKLSTGSQGHKTTSNSKTPPNRPKLLNESNTKPPKGINGCIKDE
ncbi:hypothetical protein GIB67_018274, partial [Kingdonia uniflora]